MTNPHGTPIWYELLTADAAASKAFYDDVDRLDDRRQAPTGAAWTIA